MKHILFILSFLLLSSPLFGQSEETCYVAAYSKDSEEFDPTLLSNISVSLISEFLKEVEPLPPAGISMDACVYQVDAVKVKDTTFVTFKGKNLNSFGDSKLSGPDGFQESVLKALYRALEDKRKLICDTYGEFIEKCGGVVKKIPAEKIETIREMKNKYDQLEKRIAVLDTRIEILNITAVADNPHSFELVMEKSQQGILYRVRYTSDWKEGGKKWFKSRYDLLSAAKSADERKHVVFEGDILNGVPNGQGTFTWSNGAKYVGEFKDGERNQGTLTFGKGEWEGQKYVGEFKDGEKHGQGTITSPDGRKYVGKWKNDKSHGQGTDTFPDGKKYVGEWKEGKPWNITRYNKSGEITAKWVNGVMTDKGSVVMEKSQPGTLRYLKGVTYGNGLFVTVGHVGPILTSPDGITWTERTSGISASLRGVTYGNGLFVTVSLRGTIHTSPDGITWTEKTSGISESLIGVTYGNGLFVTVGLGGTILTYSDRVTWTSRTSGTSNSLYGVHLRKRTLRDGGSIRNHPHLS